MISEAKNVTAYLTEVPEKRLEALQQLRQLYIETLIDHKESMRYKMPSYTKKWRGRSRFCQPKTTYLCIYIKTRCNASQRSTVKRTQIW